MKLAEFQRNARAMGKLGVRMSVAIAQMTEAIERISASMGTLTIALKVRPKRVLTVTMDDGVTRRVERW